MSGITMATGPEAFQYAGVVQSLMDAAKWPQPLLYDYRYVMEKLLQSKWQLWLLFDEADDAKLMMLTWVIQLPAGKMCFIELVCGEGLWKLLEKGEVFDNWCRFEQVDLVQATTRPEIARLMTHNGWETGNTSIFRWIERVQ